MSIRFGRRTGAVVASAILALVATASWSGDASGISDPGAGTGMVRVERTFHVGWEAFCDGDVCGVPGFAPVRITMPGSVGTVDVVVTATLDFETSPEDAGTILAVYSRNFRPPFTSMTPGQFPLVSPITSPSSTTLTWVATGLVADGHRYQFNLEAFAKDLDGDGRARIHGTLGTVVVEVWPAGP